MPFTGDNSATLVSMNLSEGDCVVSLGTSDTVLVYLKKGAAESTTESHLMAHPTDPEGFMGMLCYKNGSLAREHIRDLYAKKSWDTFNEYLNNNEAMNEGNIGFYYWMQEIIPFAKGIYRFEDGQAVQEFKDEAINVKAILESQFMSMKIRLQRMGGDSTKRILASGGAAANPNILQVLSNILGLPIYRQKGMNGASLGGALLAKFGTNNFESFEKMMEEYPSGGLNLICKPDMEITKQYASLIKQFSDLEEKVVQ
jgi:xylulokinase